MLVPQKQVLWRITVYQILISEKKSATINDLNSYYLPDMSHLCMSINIVWLLSYLHYATSSHFPFCASSLFFFPTYQFKQLYKKCGDKFLGSFSKLFSLILSCQIQCSGSEQHSAHVSAVLAANTRQSYMYSVCLLRCQHFSRPYMSHQRKHSLCYEITIILSGLQIHSTMCITDFALNHPCIFLLPSVSDTSQVCGLLHVVCLSTLGIL